MTLHDSWSNHKEHRCAPDALDQSQGRSSVVENVLGGQALDQLGPSHANAVMDRQCHLGSFHARPAWDGVHVLTWPL